MESLLSAQNKIMGDMDHLLVNFKKDGADRKTPSYIKKRLSTLEGYWQEFQCNHIKLCEFDDRSHEYFIKNYYNNTADFYTDTRAYILKHLPADSKGEDKSLLRPATPLASPGLMARPSGSNQQAQVSSQPELLLAQPPSFHGTSGASSSKTQGTSSKLEEMLRRQQSNFKAFARTISSINLEEISEKWEFEDVLKSIQSRWSVIDTLHWEIDSELFDANEEYERTFSRYEKKFSEMKKEINSRMWSQCHKEDSTPKMDVPIFIGSYQKWISFRDLFKEAIHSNRSLSNAQKMQFLKSKVRGEAERLIQHLRISSDNYQASWDILNHRFNNTKSIFNSHISTILNLPASQQQSAKAIKNIHDITNECLQAIKNLGVDITSWDPMIVYIISQKLDVETHDDYMDSLKNPRDLPLLQDLLQYLEAKFTNLESSKKKQSNQYQKESSKCIEKKSHQYKAYHSSNQNLNHKPSFKNIKNNSQTKAQKCPVCNKNHGIYNCDTFLQYQPAIKQRTIMDLSLCKNCLYDHRGKECYSSKKCRTCQADHNTLLHDAFTSQSLTGTIPNTSMKDQKQHKNITNVLQDNEGETLLATAMIRVQAADGSYHTMRALIDQGSQTSLISENAAQILGLPRKQCKGIIFGIGAKENNCKGLININISSMYSNYTINTDVFIMKHVVNSLPNKSFSNPHWRHLENIQLADPEFYIRRSIDILLGADIYSIIILGGIIRDNDALPIVQQTRLGWILCGNIKSYQCNVILLDVEEIQKFWSIEDISENSEISNEDQQCIQLYKSTTTRQSDGRYIVRLPLHKNVDEKLGLSKPKAVAQFYQIERKFKRHENIANDYKSFMQQYINLGHMQLVSSNKSPDYYLPHHSVQRAESTTTSLRVVFNASGPTSSGYSLNDLMYRGPNLQQDLLLLVLKWRQYKYALTADIEKMYRQIILHPDDQHYQKIVWRESADRPLQDYQLGTVTYGTKSAPFLAMMTLKQLATDESHRFPEAAKVLEDQFYMDDLLSGSHSIKSAKQLQTDLLVLLKSGGFNLRKWSSNDARLLEHVSKIHTSQENFDFKHQSSTKTLGLTWNAKDDIFTFQCKMTPQSATRITKRILLSEISKIFDPLGWLAPIVVQLKLLFQNVWTSNLNWEDTIPDNLHVEWLKLRSDIENINKIEIPRWIGSEQKDHIELHGFCDASIKAYACVVYARVHKENSVSITLLAAKTKLVPISAKSKSQHNLSLPRLELSGANLLSKLIIKIKQSLNNHITQVYGWCDSTAVLGWLQGEPNRWKPFVANRVKKITDAMPSDCWRYVKSQENPADCASRGLSVKNLREHSLWWQGPEWLSIPDYYQLSDSAVYKTNLETKKLKHTNICTQNYISDNSIITEIIDKHSSFTRVVRILSWVLRAISKNRSKEKYLTVSELRRAKIKIMEHIQLSEFKDDINHIKNHGTVKAKSNILSLSPYLDENGLLRVGGRLKNSNISHDMKHPLIIPHNGHLTDLLIDHSHRLTFHGGVRLTLSRIRQHYWLIGGNRAVKKRLRNCVVCRRHNPTKQEQIMGDLPASRINPTRPFHHTGVDFTGYVDVKASKGRGIKTSKGYIAVFICMVTKAIHLELVSDLSSSAFLAAFRRLAARRGTPSHMYSDNGTNFVGASKILTKEHINLKSIISDEFLTEISDLQIYWHFNAPSWPSAGGLWEAAVKSLKHHLRRVLGEQKLTFEEFSTLLAQLEACLNSRPLYPLTEDPNDTDCLTPSHFLSSGPVLTIFETERDERTRWQLTQKIFQDVWKRWRAEYLTQLSTRGKWQNSQANIKLNDIVIINDLNLSPGKWPLGRVIDLHPGHDGHVRVVTIKTKSGILKRPIIKLSVLPVNGQDHNKDQIRPENQDGPKPTIDENQDKPKMKRVNNKSFYNNVVSLFFLTIMLLVSTVHSTYNISVLPNDKGVYFEKLSEMRLIQDQWKLVVYYDMEPYWHGSKIFTSYLKHLEKLCVKVHNNSHCDVILLQLHHGYTELEYYDTMLLSQHFGKRSRARRGLINGVGYIANSLFGVLDEHFAEQYQHDITLIRDNQKHLASLWKNQTSIIEAENNLLKRIESTMEKQHKLFNQHLNRLESATNTIKSEIETAQITNDFILSSVIANNVLFNLKNIQDTLLDTITNVQHFNIHLLTPDQLRDELNIISSQSSKELSLPINNIITDLPELYKMLKIRARMTQQYFIFEVQIPLVNRDNYDLYQIIPVPKQVGKSLVSIAPVAEYLGMNIKRDTFIPVKENELQQCIIFDNTYLCELRTPIYQRQSDLSLCIRNNKQCRFTTVSCEIIWRELRNVNTFLFSCCGQCTLRIVCGHQVSSEQVSGTSIIAVGNDCVIRGETFTISSHKQQSNKMNLKPEIVAIEIAPINNIINLTIPVSKLNFDEDYKKSAEEISHQIEKLKSTSENLDADQLSYHDIHHYAAIYGLACFGAAGAVIAWLRRRYFNRALAQISPPPQQHQSQVQCVSVVTEQSDQCVSVNKVNPIESQSEKVKSVDQEIRPQKEMAHQATSPLFTRCSFNEIDN